MEIVYLLFFNAFVFVVRNRADAFDASIMAHLQYLLVQMARRSNTVSLNVMDSKQFLHITFQPKVRIARTLTYGFILQCKKLRGYLLIIFHFVGYWKSPRKRWKYEVSCPVVSIQFVSSPNFILLVQLAV